MRQVYRVAGADLDAASLQVGITVNRSERPQSGNAPTYLRSWASRFPSDAACSTGQPALPAAAGPRGIAGDP